MDKVQEYYKDGEYVTIWGEVKDKPELVIVTNNSDYGERMVVRRDSLVKKEDSWYFKEAQKRADELRLITAKAEENFNSITEKVITAAVKSLQTRMKMNILFGKGAGAGGWAMTIVEELDKLIREEAPKVIKDEK